MYYIAVNSILLSPFKSIIHTDPLLLGYTYFSRLAPRHLQIPQSFLFLLIFLYHLVFNDHTPQPWHC